MRLPLAATGQVELLVPPEACYHLPYWVAPVHQNITLEGGNLKPFSLLLLMGVLSATASANPITYVINFSGSGLLPTTGSFSYDSALAVNPFTNFQITWNGINFDLTSSANAPNGAVIPCGNTPASLFNVLNGGCGTAAWFAGADTSGSFFNIGEFNAPYARGLSTPAARLFTDGSYTISSAPEPTSLLLVAAGGMMTAFRRYRKGRAQTHTEQTKL